MAKPKRSKKKPRNSWTKTLLGLLIAASAGVVGLVLLRDYLNSRPIDLEPATESLATRFEQTLKDALVPADAIRLESRRTEQSRDAVWNLYHYDIEVPATLNLDRFGDLLRETMRGTGATVQDTPVSTNEINLSLHLANHEFLIARLRTAAPTTVATVRPARPEAKPEPKPEPPRVSEPEPEMDRVAVEKSDRGLTALLPWSWPPGTRSDEAPSISPLAPQLAIILDDGGYGGPATDAVLALDPRLTLAILPYTPHAADTANRAHELGFQIMLHMPMESHSPTELFQGSLLTSMNPADIDRLIQQALDGVPHVDGVNNHTGSKFTETPEAAAAMIDALHRRGLFFIDSRTIHTTVAYQTACELGVPAAQRDVFLDHENERAAIEKQWDELISICRERGAAIGIGHFRELTAQVLAEKLPQLQSHGIELVHAGNLATCAH